MLQRPYRSSAQAASIACRLHSPEYRRAAHDIYCAMFIHGYSSVTGYPVDPGTGLALVLFVVFIYAFDEQFERSRRAGAMPDYQTIFDTPQVAEIWTALAAYLRNYGKDTVI